MPWKTRIMYKSSYHGGGGSCPTAYNAVRKPLGFDVWPLGPGTSVSPGAC